MISFLTLISQNESHKIVLDGIEPAIQRGTRPWRCPIPAQLAESLPRLYGGEDDGN